MRLAKVYIVLLLMCIILCGCGKEDSVSLNPDDIVDWLYMTDENDKEFYITRVGDTYFENPEERKLVYLESGGEYPKIDDGQTAKVIADVTIYSGGEEGFCNDIFIRNLKSYEVIKTQGTIRGEELSRTFAGEEPLSRT